MNRNIKWNGLIFLKFIAVLVLIFVHSFFYLIGDYGIIRKPNSFLFQTSQNFGFIGLFILLLPILAGIIFKFQLSKEKFKSILTTSIILILLTLIMNSLTWGFWYIFSWNILDLIALTYILFYLIEKVKWKYFQELIFLISLILTPILNYFLKNYNSNYLIGILIGNNSQLIFWPIFPWISIIIFGYLIGKYYFLNEKKFTMYSILIGSIGTLVSIIFNYIQINLNPEYVWGQDMFIVGMKFIFSLMFFALFIIGISTKLFKNKTFSKYGIINSYSKGILVIYVFQMFLAFKFAKIMKENLNMNFYLFHIFKFESLFIFLFLPILMIVISWGIGALLIKLNEKKVIISIKKTK